MFVFSLARPGNLKGLFVLDFYFSDNYTFSLIFSKYAQNWLHCDSYQMAESFSFFVGTA
jgi:hypothetical protein